MLQLIDDPAAAPLVFEQREPVESDLSGLLLRITLFPNAEDAFVGMLNFPSNLLGSARAGDLVQSFQKLLCLAVRAPESAVDELAARVAQGAGLKEQGSRVPSGVTRARNQHEYSHLKDVSKTTPSDLWSPRAMSALHWHSADNSAWLSQTYKCWEGWEDAIGTPCSLSIEWQPWDALRDDVSGRDSNSMHHPISDSDVCLTRDRTPRPLCDGFLAPTQTQLSTSSIGTCSPATSST